MLAWLHINATNYFMVSIPLLKENIYVFVGRKITLGLGTFPLGLNCSCIRAEFCC